MAIRAGFLLPVLMGGLVSVLAACGFQLRGDVSLPPEMAKTQLVIDDEYTPFARRVRAMLEQSGVQFVSAKNATAVLEIPLNKVVTEVLTIGDNARVREYRIIHTVRFRLHDGDGNELVPLQTIRQAREISFDEQEILAASREQEYLKQDLVNALSRLLVSRLENAGGQGPDGSQT
jgi:LPS-assembly lipoprotein